MFVSFSLAVEAAAQDAATSGNTAQEAFEHGGSILPGRHLLRVSVQSEVSQGFAHRGKTTQEAFGLGGPGLLRGQAKRVTACLSVCL